MAPHSAVAYPYLCQETTAKPETLKMHVWFIAWTAVGGCGLKTFYLSFSNYVKKIAKPETSKMYTQLYDLYRGGRALKLS